MKTGRTLTELMQEVIRQSETKRDYVVDTRALQMTDYTTLEFGDQTTTVKDIAHSQISEHCDIPKKYYDKMKAEAPALLASNVNEWFRKYPAPRMVRTLDGSTRAFLSDRFRTLDNNDFLEAALPPLLKIGVEVMSCEVTDRKLYLKVVDSRIKKDLPRGLDLGQGHERFRTLSPALVLSNSEVGYGALSLFTSVWEGGCTNLLVIQERSKRHYHVGARHELAGEDVFAMLSDKTKRLTDAAIWAQLQDIVGAAFDVARFDATVTKLAEAAADKIEGDPIKVVEVTAKKFGFSDGERNAVLKALIQEGDLSRYGLQFAVTKACQEPEFDYDRASEFEHIGGKIIELPKQEWRELAMAA